MKKLIIISMLSLFVLQTHAQFINSIGLTVGVTAANQKYFFKDPASISRKKYVFGFNAAIMGEFLSRDYVRWVSEIQFNQKGSVDKEPIGNFATHLQYLSWNNYLKVRYELYSFVPYILIGPRIEYTMTQASSSPPVVSSFLPLHVSLAVGGGAELISYSKWKLFAELFYVPDVMPSYVSPPLHIMNKDFELRVGVRYCLHENRENCNTPTYIED